MENMSNETKSYLEHFYAPEFTSYDFVLLFSTVNALEENYSFNRDNLLDTIKKFKEDNKYDNLLEEINIKSNGIHFYSEELEDAVTNLKNGGILYTISPEHDSTIYIIEDKELFKSIQIRKDHCQEMSEFISEYNSINNKQLVKSIYNK